MELSFNIAGHGRRLYSMRKRKSILRTLVLRLDMKNSFSEAVIDLYIWIMFDKISICALNKKPCFFLSENTPKLLVCPRPLSCLNVTALLVFFRYIWINHFSERNESTLLTKQLVVRYKVLISILVLRCYSTEVLHFRQSSFLSHPP